MSRARTARAVLRVAAEPRRFGGARPRPVAWREPVEGRAPRLGPRQYIGHDVERRGAWSDRDPMVTPRWWSRWSWLALVGWLGLNAGAGWIAWRRSGGRAALFGRQP